MMGNASGGRNWKSDGKRGTYNENEADRQMNSSSILQAGVMAPDFRLNVTPDETLALSELRGSPVVLAFYPGDWSPVCGDELALFNQVLPEFKRFGAQLLGISVDGAWCHRAYTSAQNLHFPLLADFEPKGEVARAYGAYLSGAGTAGRALFVLDGEGKIHWSYLSPLAVSPGADGVLDALEHMQEAGVLAGGRTAAW